VECAMGKMIKLLSVLSSHGPAPHVGIRRQTVGIGEGREARARAKEKGGGVFIPT